MEKEKGKGNADNDFVRALKRTRDFFDKAVLMQNTMLEHGLSQNDYADMIGRSQGFVANKLRLLRLSSRVRSAIKENKLSERHARALVEMADEKKQLEMIKLIISEKFSALETEIIVKGGFDYVEKIRNIKKTKKKVASLEGMEAYFAYEKMLMVKNKKKKMAVAESMDPKIIKRIVLSSNEAKEVTVKNIKTVKNLLKNIEKVIKKAEEQGIVVERNMRDDYEHIVYEISIPKKDNLLWK